MPAYVIIEIKVHDAAKFEEYKRKAPPSIAAYGGKYLVRGGPVETLDGTWAPERIVFWSFPRWLERANGTTANSMPKRSSFAMHPRHRSSSW